MARARSSTETINTPSQKRRKATQRGRLIAGMIMAANRDGYAGANVTEVITEAGVSRPTFYDYFEDRDACFIAAISDVQERLLSEIRGALEGAAPERALATAVHATVAFAGSDPDDARFLMKESLAGGPKALDARDRGILGIATAIEARQRTADAAAPIPDVAVVAVLGAVQRLLAVRLRRGERGVESLQDDLRAWLQSYDQPAAAHRWRPLKPHTAPPRSPYLPPTALRPPAPFGPGRPRMSAAEVAENHRQRIMFATARVVQERGYSAATVKEITRVADVEPRSFYRQFSDRQDAFSAIHELGFQYLMAASAGAFFSGGSWPERIWEGFRAATQSVDDTPAFAHVGFVEAYAVGPRGIERVEDSRMAFTIFLQEGYRDERAGDAPPSRLALEAIIATVFEIVYLQARASAKPATAGLLGHIVYLCLAPFLGAEVANDMIDAQLAPAPKPTGAPRRAGTQKNAPSRPRRGGGRG